LAKPREVHLNPEEIERISAAGWKPSGGEPKVPEKGLEELFSHLSACSDCRGRVRMYEQEKTRWSNLLPHGKGKRGADCPQEEEWLRLAAGLTEGAQAEALLRHAAGCDFCGPILARATEDFRPELTGAEEREIAGLASAGKDWRRGMAQTLSQTAAEASAPSPSTPRGKGWASNWFALAPRWSFGVATALILAAGLWWYHLNRSNNPNQLLAEAYTQQRTLELRFPGANYGPLRVERGGKGASRLDRPEPLLEAEARIKRGVTAHPGDPAWLQANGRAELLEWGYEAAMVSFKRALEIHPDSPSVKVDLASAYFERAEAEDRAIDYGAALELLGQALAKQPDDPVALFNRAIVYERMFMYRQAMEDWEHLLKLESQGAWAAEATTHLAKDQKLILQKQSSRGPITDPMAFLQTVREEKSRGEPTAADHQGFESEDYLDVAITQWLPLAFPDSKGSQNSAGRESAQQALRVLASTLFEQHQDRWLAEMLAASSSGNSAEAVSALASALAAASSGNPAEAKAQALRAEAHFRSIGDQPGDLRARFEETYALQRSQDGTACLAAASALVDSVQGHAYRWVEAQALIEKAICQGMTGDFGKEWVTLGRAQEIIRTANYPSLLLRKLGMAAAIHSDDGDIAGSWAQDRAGLALFWSGDFPPARGYQFYSDMGYSSEDQSRWTLALASWREAVPLISLTQNHTAEAMACFRLAAISGIAGERAAASREFRRSESLFAQYPSEATERYRVYDEISLAELDSSGDRNGSALRQLEGLKEEILKLKSFIVQMQYYEILGELMARRGDSMGAEKELWSAARMSQLAGSSLADATERLTWARETSNIYHLLVRIALRERSDPLGALQLWEEYKATAFGLARTPAAARDASFTSPPLTLSAGDSQLAAKNEFAKYLTSRRGEIRISYAQFPEGLAVWKADEQGVDSLWEPVAGPQLKEAADLFIQQCSDRGTDVTKLQQNGRKLYDWLIAPMRARLKSGETLVIETDGDLARIPFPALMDGAGVYLGANFPIVLSPGAIVDARLGRPVAMTPDLRALVVGSPAIGGGSTLVPLSDALDEASAVASRFKQPTLLEGKQATVEAVEQGLANAQVFHFAGHSLTSASHAGLLLSPALAISAGIAGDDLLDAFKLRPNQLPHCALAVLSACSTGTWKGEAGDPASIAHGFLNAGVPDVVASQWDVDSSATAAFMQAFYGALLSGQNVSAAVRSAGNSIRAGAGTSHPYYWAGFSTYGRT
jgi:CHAT domain-containing protein